MGKLLKQELLRKGSVHKQTDNLSPEFLWDNKLASHAQALVESVLRNFPKYDIYFTGHSLGGYLAQKATAKICSIGKVGNLKLSANFNAPSFLNFQNPSELLDYTTLGIMAYDKMANYRVEGDLVSLIGVHVGPMIKFDSIYEFIEVDKAHMLTSFYYDQYFRR